MSLLGVAINQLRTIFYSRDNTCISKILAGKCRTQALAGVILELTKSCKLYLFQPKVLKGAEFWLSIFCHIVDKLQPRLVEVKEIEIGCMAATLDCIRLCCMKIAKAHRAHRWRVKEGRMQEHCIKILAFTFFQICGRPLHWGVSWAYITTYMPQSGVGGKRIPESKQKSAERPFPLMEDVFLMISNIHQASRYW